MTEKILKFDRKPYTINYIDMNGERQSIKRRPPNKMHSILPVDTVELQRKKSDDFSANEQYTVKHINPRHANTLQLENDEGQTTFVEYFDLDLKKTKYNNPQHKDKDSTNYNAEIVPINSDYLLWP